MAAAAILRKCQMAISPQPVVRSTPRLVLGWCFQKRRMALFPVRKIGRHLGKISNGHTSASGRPIYFMFVSRVGFSETADLMALFPVRKIQDGGGRHLGKISNGHISATGRPIHSMFGSRVVFSRTADLMALFPVRKIGRHLGKISNGYTSASGGPIYSMFVSIVGFSETADLMALFPVRKNPRWRPPTSWKNFKWPYLRNRSSDPLHVWF